MRVWLVLVMLAPSLVAAPKFWGELEPGRHAVGFRIVQGGSLPGSAGWQPRPIEIAIWYPAERSDRPALTFGNYFDAAEDLRRRSGDLATAMTGDASGLTPEQTRQILETPMYAQREAAPAPGAYPVAMWSARYGTVAAQSVLSEYLASRGFVVAAARPKEVRERLPFEAETSSAKIEELDAQSDDLRGALRAVRALPVADDTRAALLAWSYAGESAWRIAQSDARIELVIALDTNVESNWAYHPARAGVLRTASLSLHRATPELAGLAHGNFNALEGMIPGVMGIERVQRWSKGGAIAQHGYETLARQIASALHSTFTRDAKVAYETVELRSSDGSIATAEIHRAVKSSRCVGLFHQSGSSRGEFRTIAPELAKMGWSSLSVDVRWGWSDRWNDVVNQTAARVGTPAVIQKGDPVRMRAIQTDAMKDLDAAIDWLRREGCSTIVVWGSSIMANGVFEVAARRPDHVSAVIDVSPGEYDKERPDRMKALAATVRQPSLVLWGRHERDVSKPIYDALPAPEKWFYESTGRHGNAVFFEDPGSWVEVRKFLATLP